MAFAFRPVRTDPVTGKKTRVRKWYARWKDPATGRWRTRAGYRDKRATKALADRMERDAARRHEGLAVPGDPKPIGEHVEDWERVLRARGTTKRHPAEQARRVRAVIDGCGWTSIGEINQSDLEVWLDEQRALDGQEIPGREFELPPEQEAARRQKRGRRKPRRKRFGITTSNAYLTAVRTFSAWLASKRSGRRLDDDPLEDVERLNPELDPRHVRRTLKPEEFSRLLDAANAGPVAWGLSGPARRVLYLTAAYSGLRADELAGLTPRHLHLSLATPVIDLPAAEDKARRGFVLPLHRDVAAELAAFTAGMRPDERIWPGRWAVQFDAAKMLRRDLAAAGVPYKDDRGRVFDFHALRSQFVTDLLRSGLDLATVQKLARHADPATTARHYARFEVDHDLAAGVQRLPPPPRVQG